MMFISHLPLTNTLGKLLFLLMLVSWSNPAFSMSVNGIYNAQIAVDDQSASQMHKAKGAGLSEVLVKVTGQTQSLKNPSIRKALDDAQIYLQQFSFSTKLVQGQPQAMMELAFDKLQVNQLISNAGLPIWGTDRAAVLVWLVEDKQGTRQIVNGDGHPMVAQIMSQAQQRGMPLLWPLLDLEDQVAIDAGALWGGFRDTIKAASSRYQADAILVGRMFQDSQDLWRVEWSFWLDNIEQKWSSEGADLAALVDPLQDRLASSLVAKFALAVNVKDLDGVLQSAVLRVNQVTQFEDYLELREMLQAIEGIQRVQLHSASGATLEFKLFTQSNLAQVKSIVDLKRRLKLVDTSEAQATIDEDEIPLWHYQWN